jgi:hypothetical protein
MYPTIEQVIAADHYQFCEWYRFLPSPVNSDESAIMLLIHEGFYRFGGFTPEMSKQIGWTK